MFFLLLAITNNDYSPSAEILAKYNGIQLIRRGDLNKLVLDLNITVQDINKLETQRIPRM